MADNITYIKNENVTMNFDVGIDVTTIDTDNSYITMIRSDGSKVNLSIDDTDSDNNLIIHDSTDTDFSVEGTYEVQPYLVLNDDGGKFLCEADIFFVRGTI